MINKKLLLTAGAVAFSASFFSTTATAATDTGDASATVLTPLSIVVGANPMHFGDVAGDANNTTTITLAPGGGTTASPGANAAGLPTPGDFTVTGSGTLAYNISFPVSTVLTGLGADMIVDTFSANVGTSSSLTAGSDSFTVGAVLHINPAQLADSYTGTYVVTIEYQ